MRPIAIIGASCRFPGATGLDEFWRLLREGRNAVGTVPPDRWDPDLLYSSDPDAPGKITTRHGAFITGIKEFDCGFFGISPREAAIMDPQQRLLLEAAYEAFEDAGLPMEALAGSKTGVYVGIGPGDYGRMCAQAWHQIGAHYATGNFLSIAADRIPYFFDLRGPSMAVDTACSSSLVAVHLACRSIESGECEMALAGGVNALLSPPLSISLGKAGALSPTGRCRAFDANADGYVRGEGAGFVVLRDLASALAAGDRVYAVIAGSAINQSGRRNGLTAPGSWGEESVMLTAWNAAGIGPAEADFVETHGTGTVLGDAIEARSMGNVFGDRKSRGLCRIGSVKTNFGHLETAAGIAGLIKLALMIRHGEFVPSLFPETPNPHVNLEQLGLTVQMRPELWPMPTSRGRIGGVSSFGLGGTYAHVCATSAPIQPAAEEIPESPGLLLPLSARHAEALRSCVRETARLLDQADSVQALKISRSAARRRTHHNHRVAFAGLCSEEVVLAMNWWLQKGEATKVPPRRKLVIIISDGRAHEAQISAAARVFGGQGSARGAFVDLLRSWGVNPYKVFRVFNEKLFIETNASDLEAADQRIELRAEDVIASGDDFIDLTGSGLFNELPNGNALAGFSPDEDPKLTVLRLAGALYQRGYSLAWERIYPGIVQQVNLPTYRWQHQTCWLETAGPSQRSEQPKNATSATAVPGFSTEKLIGILARVSGMRVAEIHEDSSPADVGIDSLMTLELIDDLKKSFGITVAAEAIVKVGSVRELEKIVEDAVNERANSASNPALAISLASRFPKTLETPVPLSASSSVIREAQLDDYEQIAALTVRNGLDGKSRAEWEHLWIGNPVYKKLSNWPIGWVVESGSGIAGFIGNIPITSHFRGREIVGSSIHAFSLDATHRGYGLLLLERLLGASPQSNFVIGSTANANSSKVLDRAGVARVPAGDWENTAFWITNYEGFLDSAIATKGWPKIISQSGATALRLRDKLLKKPWPQQQIELRECLSFDDRFDAFWEELRQAYPQRFLPARSAAVLNWHFQYALSEKKAWVVAHEDAGRVRSYAVFFRHDNPDIGLTRARLVDFQTLEEERDVLPSILRWGLETCRAHGIQMLEALGFRTGKQQIINHLAPHRRRLPGWLYFYKATMPELSAALTSPDVWDPSQYDGDASL